MSRLKILSFTCTYPTPVEPAHGLFIRSRIVAMAEIADIVVLAPLPLIDYGNPHRRLFQSFEVDRKRSDAGLEILHPKWFYPPMGGSWNASFLAAGMAPQLAAIRRRFPFDIIDAQHGHPDGTAAESLGRSSGRPYAITLRGNETAFGSRGGRLRRTLQNALCGAARVISVSEPLRRFAMDLGVDPHRAKTISNGVNSKVFHPRNRSAMRAKYNLDPEARIVLSAGHLCERKGHHRVVDAIAHAVNAGENVRFVIAGGGSREDSYEPVIRKRAAELGISDRVLLAGEVSHDALAEWMSAADIFCLATRREGWPNVVHEAMACGCPIVSTDVGGIPDLVPSERYGTLVPFGDGPALAQALLAALRRDWDRTAITAWAHSRSWEQVAREEVDEFAAAVDEYRQEKKAS